MWSAGRDCAAGGCWCPTDVTGVTAQEWGSVGAESAFAVTTGLHSEAIVTGWGDLSPQQPGMFVGSKYLKPDVDADWVRTWDSHKTSDKGVAVMVDTSGAVLIGGNVSSALSGATNAGGDDLAVTKWNADSSLAWNAEWGSNTSDRLYGFVQDSLGGFYVAGSTNGDLAAVNPMPGDEDMVLSKLDATGHVSWKQQWGGTGRDELTAIAIDAQDNVYVVGTLADEAYCSKRDKTGKEVWTTTWGTSGHDAAINVVRLDTGELMVVGFFGSSDVAQSLDQGAFLSKLDATGKVLWSHTIAKGMTADARGLALGSTGDLFITGAVRDELVSGAGKGSDDVYVMRVKPDGTIVWTKQIGTTDSDLAYGIALTADDKIYVAVDTFGAFPGFVNQGETDAVVLYIAQP